jgi:predicted pyridoxine 5'-phosphate oxidase superfamily flavin-nucleotide-binding protein
MKINEAVRVDIQNSVLCWLATVDEKGVPNVTPKELFASHGEERIVIADIASSRSVRNIQARPQACISFVDVFRQRGFKITGRAEIVQPHDKNFSDLGTDLLRMAGTEFPIRNIISVEIERIARIWAPSYTFFPALSEGERMQSAYDAYGVQPKPE